MSQQINIQDSVTLNPSGYSDLTSLTTATNYPITNGYTDTSSTTYARLTISSGATGYVYFTFDTSAIPENATIDSIAATAKVRVSSTTTVTNTVCQLYSNTTAKGSNTTFASTSTSNIVTLTPGTWTRQELENLSLRIGGTGASSGGGGGNTRYIYFYGANVVINYSVNDTQYTITATSVTQDVTVDPSTQNALSSKSATINIHVNDIDGYVVTDNDVDVTESLVRHAIDNSGVINATADSFTTGGSTSSVMFFTSSSSQTNNFNYAVGHTAEDPGSTSSGSGSWTYVKTSTGSNQSTTETGWAEYSFDFSSIPAGSTITGITVKCYGAVEDSSQSTSHSDVTLYSGSTQKGTTQSFTSSTNSIMTISDAGTWTREELQNAILRFTVGYYGGHLFGITWTVEYEVPAGADEYYYTYTIDNMADDHVVIVDLAGAYIPPEEDPEYTYYPITISSINATTNPTTGTTRVVEGSDQTVLIYPTDPLLTLALDNGVDITSQLQNNIPTNTYSVETASGASYGFTLNNNDYYESTNQGVASSAAVARVYFTLETQCAVTFKYINYAESTYDYGIFGQIDTALGTTYTADSGAYLTCNTAAYNVSTEQEISYVIPSGSHYIDVKYRKDTSQDSNNDSLQFKIEIESTEGSGNYTYSLEDIQERHNLIFVFGEVNYYFVTSSGTGCRLFPDGQQVKLEGQSYKINIVPDNTTDIVTLRDNDVVQTLERKETVDDKQELNVSYLYTISNIQAAHNLIITSVAAANDCLYLKLNNTWTEVTTLWVKEKGVWVEGNLSYLSDNNITNLMKLD